ncbi:DNA-directed DNA polymerase [Rhodopseudomonas palustris TIE-1]|nr:DNA-directed DNA polymerase [Rhodopseudomonas palustris TIE-1]
MGTGPSSRPDVSDVAAPAAARKIIHVDMDAFYASVEQRDDPALRGKPVAVGGSRERGVVAAASYEARKFGVRSAMPSVTAKRQCPDLIFVKPRFEVYKAISQQIREIFAEHTAIIEPLSLDEAYLDVTENLQNIPLARDIALAIRAKIKEVTGLNASAGISYNKFLAKLASDHRKPNGQYVISPEMGPSFVEGLPVGKFHGIGPATAAKFNALGIRTGSDIRGQLSPGRRDPFVESPRDLGLTNFIDYLVLLGSRLQSSGPVAQYVGISRQTVLQGRGILVTSSLHCGFGVKQDCRHYAEISARANSRMLYLGLPSRYRDSILTVIFHAEAAVLRHDNGCPPPISVVTRDCGFAMAANAWAQPRRAGLPCRSNHRRAGGRKIPTHKSPPSRQISNSNRKGASRTARHLEQNC